MSQPSRRTFLGTAGLALASAGCLGEASERPGSATEAKRRTSTTTESPAAVSLGTEQTVGGVSVRVSNLSVQDSALTRNDDTMTLHTTEGERYVLVSVSGSESGTPSDTFSLGVDDDTYASRVDVFGRHASLDERGAVYDPSYGTDTGWIGFVVPPTVDAERGRVLLEYGGETAAWRLTNTQIDALRRPRAAFELREVALPTRIRPYAPVSVRVVAENVSDVAGVFRGVLNVAGLNFTYAPYPFELRTEPGETAVWEKTFREGPSKDTESVGFFLETVAGGKEVRVPVGKDAETETATGTETAVTAAMRESGGKGVTPRT